jgi:Ubiquinol cytochrome reductase transmembrane region
MSSAWTRLARSAAGAGARAPLAAAGGVPSPAFAAASRAAIASASTRAFAAAKAGALTPTISGAGIIGPDDPKSNNGPGFIPTGFIDEYHNHSHRNAKGDPTKRAFTYLVLGTTKFVAASAARVLVLKLIYTMSASADVLAKGSVEVDLSAIPLGTTATLKWRGKPVFIRHRSEDEIALAAKDDNAELRDPQTDLERVEKPEWVRSVAWLPRSRRVYCTLLLAQRTRLTHNCLRLPHLPVCLCPPLPQLIGMSRHLVLFSPLC